MTLDEIYDYALSFYGVPYEWGGSGPNAEHKPTSVRNLAPGGYGFDCSGYVQAILKKANVKLPAQDSSAHELFLFFSAKGAPSRERGALAFFGTEERVSHVGWLIDPKIMLNAAGGGSNVRTIEMARRLNAGVKIQPITRHPGLVGCFLPNYLT